MAESKTSSEPRERDPFRTINPPLHRASTVLYPTYEEFLKADQPPYHGKVYGTFGSPVQLELERALEELEGGYACRVCPSGYDAICVVLMALTRSDDHILISDNVYGPTRHFCQRVLGKYRVEVETLPPTIGADVEPYIKPNTRLIYLESPGSNTFELQDVPAVTEVARSKGIVTALDNTWATPLFFKPFDHGVDISIHSGSKYMGGHSDALLGSITTNEAVFEKISRFYDAMEKFASPESCYAILKGLKTLELRLARHRSSALAIAAWLQEHPAVETVIHPALDSHPEHALWKRNFSGASGVFSFLLKDEPTRAGLSSLMDPMRVFKIGLSWGGFQSLIKAGKVTDRTHPFRYQDRTMIRLSVGLEEIDAMKADLADALDRLR